MKRVAILVTHLLGSGHLSRALVLARALADAGLQPLVISGGMPAAHLGQAGLDVVQLPPVRSDGAHFTRLLDTSGELATPELMQSRTDRIVETLTTFQPDCLITELFPFGRRVLRAEFQAALDAVGALPRPAIVLASIRDILAPPSSQKKADQTAALLAQYFDGVLVHADKDVLPLEASWPVTPDVAAMLHYTGFIAPPLPDAIATSGEGEGEILVTAGGGPVGRRLFEAAVSAAALTPGLRWRILVGGADAVQVCANLNAAAGGADVVAEPTRPDYRALLARSAAAIGQCGYNTAIDWLQAGVPGVFVPFAEGGEVEQTIRAESLRQRYGYECIAEDDLTPENLAAAAQAAIRRGRFRLTGLKLDGAAESSRIVSDFLAARA
jgi:predicted glycosyltransferase